MIAAYSVGQSMWVNRYFINPSNIVETPFTFDVGNNTGPIAQNAFDTCTRCTTLLMAFLIPQAYFQLLNSRTLSLFTPAAQNFHQWSECHAMSFGQDDVWMNPVNDAMRGSRSISLYRNLQLDPLPLGKVGPP